MLSFSIAGARDGGFFVLSPFAGEGNFRETLFAGTLDECLVYVKRKLKVDTGPDPKPRSAKKPAPAADKAKQQQAA